MHVSDRKACLGSGLFLASIIIPFPAFIIGWVGWNVKTGLLAASAAFAGLILLSIILVSTVKDPGWFAAFLPFGMATGYVVLPDWIIGGFDDAAVMFAGAFGTLVLVSRKLGNIPKSAVFAFLVAAIYPLFGQFVPGPIDDLLVSTISGGTGIALSLKANHKKQTQEIASSHP